MNIRQLVEGATILAKYALPPAGVPDGDGWDAHMEAEHDYGPDDVGEFDVSAEDRAELERLGWHADSDTEGWARFC